MKRMRIPLARVFAVPAALAAVSGAGLVWALLAEGGQDQAAGLAVAAPIIAVAWAAVRRRI